MSVRKMKTIRINGNAEMEPPPRRPPRRPLRRATAAAAVTGLAGALALSACAGVAAAGATPAGTRAASSSSTQGTVVGIDRSADSFTLRTSSGSRVTVKVTSSTTYDESGVSKPTFSDLGFGDSVVVIGSTSNGVDTASVVIIGHRVAGGFPGGGGFRGGTFGRVTSVDTSADTFVIKTFTGSSVTVKVTSKTTYRDSGSSSAGFSDVKVGETVGVTGSTSNGVETATTVIIGVGGGGGFPGGGGLRNATLGKVTSVDRSGDTFVIKTSAGKNVTVKVTSKTTFRVFSGRPSGSSSTPPAGSFSDVKVGVSVAVTGSTSNGVETATTVLIGVGAFRRPPSSGSTGSSSS
ncbi:MAG TPA: hypothetical protein VMD59_15040 [Acidimicrobiales bacterium]|nr:hypothetical protein [Acidimicrobiales bacterium]